MRSIWRVVSSSGPAEPTQSMSGEESQGLDNGIRSVTRSRACHLETRDGSRRIIKEKSTRSSLGDTSRGVLVVVEANKLREKPHNAKSEPTEPDKTMAQSNAGYEVFPSEIMWSTAYQPLSIESCVRKQTCECGNLSGSR